MSHARIDDIDVAYTEAGSGRPVVLLHGLAEGRGSWANQQQALAAYRTYAYDLRGHGDTQTGTGAGSVAQLGRDLIGFLEAVTGPATVVGFSLGGTIALWAAAERSDLIPRLVVLGTSSVVGRTAVGFYEDRIAKAADTASSDFRNAMRSDTVAGLAREHADLDAIVAARLAAVGAGAGYINASRAMIAMHADPLTQRLAEVHADVTVVGGSDDRFCPAKAAQILMGAISGAVFEEVPKAGHLMNIDNPGAVTRILLTAIGNKARES